MTVLPPETGDGRAAAAAVVFSSQREWLAWLDTQRPSSVKSTNSITLRLTDTDLSPLLDQSRHEQISAWHLYRHELTSLDRGLDMVSGLVHLRIIPPAATNPSQLVRGMYLSFLKLLPRRLPCLRRLDLDDSDSVLTLVPALADFPEVNCAAYPGRTAVRAPARTVSAATRSHMMPTVVSYATDGRASSGIRTPVRMGSSMSRSIVQPRPA